MSASEVGEIFDIAEYGYRLLVIGTHWALVENECVPHGEIVAQDYRAANYASAKQAGLMAARVYVPHFGMNSTNKGV